MDFIGLVIPTLNNVSVKMLSIRIGISDEDWYSR